MIGKLDCNVCREMCFRDLVSSLRWSSFNDVFPLWRLCGSTRRRMWQWLCSVARSSCLQLELTTPYGLICMHSGTSWVYLCIVYSVLLCLGGQKIVCHTRWSSASGGPPSSKHALPTVFKNKSTWLQYWGSLPVLGPWCLWQNHSSGCWGWCVGSVDGSARGAICGCGMSPRM